MFGSPLLAAFQRGRQGQARLATPLNEVLPTIVPEPKRVLQNVSTKAQRLKVVSWMIDRVHYRGGTVGHIASEALKKFPDVFRSRTPHANLNKASRWWRTKEVILASCKEEHLSVSHTFRCRGAMFKVKGQRLRVELKASVGRGRKLSSWVKWLHPLLLEEFYRLKAAGLKFTTEILRLLAQRLLQQHQHPHFYPVALLDGSTKTLEERITSRWIQHFKEHHNIVHRTQTGKLMVSPAKQEFIERQVAFHMGELRRGFLDGTYHQDLMENMDETHFIINMDNGRTLGFKGDSEVKYQDVVSAGVGFTMVVKLTGGQAAKLLPP